MPNSEENGVIKFYFNKHKQYKEKHEREEKEKLEKNMKKSKNKLALNFSVQKRVLKNMLSNCAKNDFQNWLF